MKKIRNLFFRLLILISVFSCSVYDKQTYEDNLESFEDFTKFFVANHTNKRYISSINLSELNYDELEFFLFKDNIDFRSEYCEKDEAIYIYIRSHNNKETNSDYAQTFYFQYFSDVKRFKLVGYAMWVG